jgi:hypothetical protein
MFFRTQIVDRLRQSVAEVVGLERLNRSTTSLRSARPGWSVRVMLGALVGWVVLAAQAIPIVQAGLFVWARRRVLPNRIDGTLIDAF